jgi:2-oxoglutarate dehydrogenase E1 component
MIPESGAAYENAENVKRLVFCTGRVYYDLSKERAAKHLNTDVAISRIEQLSPFPFDLVKAEITRYPKAKISWVQEEHKNQGGWSYVFPRIRTALKKEGSGRSIEYIGRHASAATATGSKAAHIQEFSRIIKKVFEHENI